MTSATCVQKKRKKRKRKSKSSHPIKLLFKKLKIKKFKKFAVMDEVYSYLSLLE